MSRYTAKCKQGDENMLQSIPEKGRSTMTAPFRAFVVDQTADGFQMGIHRLEQRDLPPGDGLNVSDRRQ